jgi:hypothetical protein
LQIKLVTKALLYVNLYRFTNPYPQEQFVFLVVVPTSEDVATIQLAVNSLSDAYVKRLAYVPINDSRVTDTPEDQVILVQRPDQDLASSINRRTWRPFCTIELSDDLEEVAANIIRELDFVLEFPTAYDPLVLS